MPPRILLSLSFSVLAAVALMGCDGETAGPGSTVTGDKCGCGDAVCGFDLCGNACGTCGEAGKALCSGGQCVDSSSCSAELIGFQPTAEAAYNRTTAGKTVLIYGASTGSGTPPFEKVVVELDHRKFFADGLALAGVYDLAGQDPNDCGMCVRGYSLCNQDDCFNKFVVEEGQVELIAPGEPGGAFTGRFRGLKLKEMLIDKSTGKFKPHPNAKTFCMGDFPFDIEVPEIKEAEGTCVEQGTGIDLNDNIGDFTLTNCLGEEVNLHTRCGLYNAVWIVATAGWCGACEAFVPVVAQEYAENKGRGLDIMIVVGETSNGTKPDLAYCYQYATDKGVDPRQVFIDSGAESWGDTFAHINTYGSSIGLPWSAVLEGSGMEYKWNSSVGEGGVIENVHALLP